MLHCREVTELLASGALAESTWHRRASVRMHLLLCRHCRRYAAQLSIIGAVARSVLQGGAEIPRDAQRMERFLMDALPMPEEDDSR